MKKISWATHKSLFGQIATSTCLVSASAGVVFGVSAATFKIEYFNLQDTNARLTACNSTNYYSQQISSQWNMYVKKDAQGKVLAEEQAQPYSDNIKDSVGNQWWKDTYGTLPKWCENESDRKINIDAMKINEKGKSTSDMIEARKKMGTLIIDGATHTALDRSFNQSLYNGIANFVTNEAHDITGENEGVILKPSQDSTQEFVNIYRKAAETTKTLCLAGFNHVTPINALGKQDGAKYKFDDKNINKTGMLLIDGDISNNQNVASVLFRSDQPAFLTALSTCTYFYNNLEVYHDHFQDISVAAFGGTAIPTVSIYMGGFQRGVEFFNHFILWNKMIRSSARNYLYKDEIQDEKTDYFLQKLLPASKYKKELKEIREMEDDPQGKKKAAVDEICTKLYEEYSIKMIKLGNFGTHFSGSFAAGDAIGISKQYLNRGASAIIGVAGPQTLDTIQEVMNQQKGCIVIGVDCAMENSDYQKPFINTNFKDRSVDAKGKQSKQASSILKFSAVKDMTSVSDKILRLAASGKNWDVTNKTPWTTKSQIPSWTKEQEMPLGNLNIVPNGDGKTFDVSGFTGGTPVSTFTVLSIPTQIVDKDTKKTLYLRNINNNGGDPRLGFNETNLKSIKTLKIQAVSEQQPKFTFGEKCFQFDENSQCGFQYIDLTEVPCHKVNTDGITYEIFPNMGKTTASNVHHKGVIKLGKAAGAKDHENLFKFLLKNGKGGTNEGWEIVEADPEKSICSFGFKTCGNIENGLISISWDGWAPLIDCLRQLEGLGHPTITGQSFMDIWKDEVEDMHSEGLIPDDKFYKAVSTNDWKDLCTYDTESILHKNYSQLISILGRVLKNSVVVVPRDMTVMFDDAGKAYIPTKAQQMSILDWLKNNMYFIV